MNHRRLAELEEAMDRLVAEVSASHREAPSTREIQLVSARGLAQSRRAGARRITPRPVDRGWWLDEGSAERLVSAYSRLRLRPGVRLVTYVRTDGGNATGWTFALSSGASTPPVDAICSPDQFAPTPPPEAKPHFMDAIEGDDSLRSYVQASVLGRDLAELGAEWHGLDWATHFLVGPPPSGSETPALYGDRSFRPSANFLLHPEWQWSERPPEDWRPRAVRDASGDVLVEFHSYSELGSAAVYVHRDVYEGSAGLAPVRVEVRTIGGRPGGFVF